MARYGDLEDSSTSFDQCLRVNAAGYYFLITFLSTERRLGVSQGETLFSSNGAVPQTMR